MTRAKKDPITAHSMLRNDVAEIIRSVDPSWRTRGYSDVDLKVELRKWAEKITHYDEALESISSYDALAFSPK
jgi:hypothetical protein